MGKPTQTQVRSPLTRACLSVEVHSRIAEPDPMTSPGHTAADTGVAGQICQDLQPVQPGSGCSLVDRRGQDGTGDDAAARSAGVRPAMGGCL
jgi:hypothetical protein